MCPVRIHSAATATATGRTNAVGIRTEKFFSGMQMPDPFYSSRAGRCSRERNPIIHSISEIKRSSSCGGDADEVALRGWVWRSESKIASQERDRRRGTQGERRPRNGLFWQNVPSGLPPANIFRIAPSLSRGSKCRLRPSVRFMPRDVSSSALCAATEDAAPEFSVSVEPGLWERSRYYRFKGCPRHGLLGHRRFEKGICYEGDEHSKLLRKRIGDGSEEGERVRERRREFALPSRERFTDPNEKI